MVKYLGFTLDSTLRWKQHVDLTLAKATKALMVCNRLAGKSWGCNPRIIRWLYTMIVRPIITYGAVAWVSKASQTSVGLQLSKLQRLACICASGDCSTGSHAGAPTVTSSDRTDGQTDPASNESRRVWQREGYFVPADEDPKWRNASGPSSKGQHYQRNYRNKSITILRNRHAALKAISAFEVKSLLVQECVERLNSLSSRN